MHRSRLALVAVVLLWLTASADAEAQRVQQAQQTLVIEGVERDTTALRELRQEFGATRVQLPGPGDLEVWQAPADRIEELQERVREASQGIFQPRITQMQYSTILAPTSPEALNEEQQAIAAAIARSTGSAPQILRRNDTALVRQALEYGFIGQGLFRGRSFYADLGDAPGDVVEFRQTESTESEWSGVLADDGFATLRVDERDMLSGNVSRGDRYVEFRSLGGDLYATVEMTISESFTDEPRLAADRMAIGASAGRSPAPGQTPIVDVLVLYTAAADATATDEPNTFGRDRILDLNDTVREAAQQNLLQFRLAGVEPVNYIETNYLEEQHIVNLRDRGPLHARAVELRNLRRADIVVLVIAPPDVEGVDTFCGEAGSIGPIQEKAFVVVNQACFSYHSFQHEVGHLFGNRHNIEEDAEIQPAEHGHGYLLRGIRQRTIMSYPTGCAVCSRIPRWSNPQQTLRGRPLGQSQTADESRVLRENAADIAAFR